MTETEDNAAAVDPGPRCGFVALIGAPNAGKSTLLNQLVGEKVSIVTHKVQTTRAIVRGIATHGNAQIVFVDTPGIFKPRRRLDTAMVTTAWGGAKDADIVLVLIDAERGIKGDADHRALVDGCTRFEVLRKVVFPMARAGLFATAVFTFVFAWNDFIFALVLTRREVTTFPVQVTHYFGGQSNFWAKIAAMSVLGTVPIFIAVATLQRYLVRGISLGAVKG